MKTNILITVIAYKIGKDVQVNAVLSAPFTHGK